MGSVKTADARYLAVTLTKPTNHRRQGDALRDEPMRLPSAEFVTDQRDRLVGAALEQEQISLSRAAEIIGISIDKMQERQASWTE